MGKQDRMAALEPTLHPHTEELVIQNVRFKTFDLGGHETARQLWRDYYTYAEVDGIVFLLDASDRTRFDEAREELNRLLNECSLSAVPFVMLGNKIDIPTAASEDELRQQMELYNHKTSGKDVIKSIC